MQNKESRRRKTWIVVAVVVLAAGLAAWWWKGRAGEGAGGPSASASAPAGGPGGRPGSGARFGRNGPQPVSASAVQRRDMPVVVNAIGSIASANTAVVRAKVSGELKALYFKEGQPVKAGQVLALIDPRPFEIARDQAAAALARDKAQLENARADLTRYKDLVAQEAAPRQQLDTQQALVHQLEATVLADQAALDNARLQLSYTRVTAPISGQVGLKQADLGNNVGPSDANGLLSIAQTQPAAVVFAVPDQHLARIRQQLADRQPLPVKAWDREQRQQLADGRVASTDNAIDAATSTIKVKALFDNKDGGLFPNQFVNVRLQLDTLKNALVVSTAAVQRGTPGTFVYVVADGTVVLRKVRVLATDGESTAVQGELKPGDQVVTDGADRLRDGGKAEVIQAPAGGAPAVGGWRGRNRGADGAASGASGPAGVGSPAAAASGSGSGDGGERPRWMDRVPPEMVDKIKAMSPDERRAWFQQQRGSAPAQ
ncbi:MdtA/MuxA family multidrug efflux RND transporter periplasmic adaptor subunit [Pelomonas cellulosilytica]|uniref:MdtA/MuxA family multidrug efflux RND transporter periplasmic adaptor subunit n=1 Tax=Pelomonas cellulosilytica TaxID=2906762 RepID=A0ABS8Y266_9BURK|nr:MdtA/MuxA family multidrug efflux RND transporter periplasmic adaptor subunit [Pelomonas sp. P8]MCE4557046.1 MdtA/MuxA family multidrug efflux RND transporter periplasmic adaptor subunit [Pelomonas sp. P8]